MLNIFEITPQNPSEEKMIEFTLKVRVKETEDPECNYLSLFKKMQWPVLPRVGEWVAVTEDSVAYKVEDVWHYVKDDGTPDIQIEMWIRLYDYKKLEQSPLWSE